MMLRLSCVVFLFLSSLSVYGTDSTRLARAASWVVAHIQAQDSVNRAYEKRGDYAQARYNLVLGGDYSAERYMEDFRVVSGFSPAFWTASEQLENPAYKDDIEQLLQKHNQRAKALRTYNLVLFVKTRARVGEIDTQQAAVIKQGIANATDSTQTEHGWGTVSLAKLSDILRFKGQDSTSFLYPPAVKPNGSMATLEALFIAEITQQLRASDKSFALNIFVSEHIVGLVREEGTLQEMRLFSGFRNYFAVLDKDTQKRNAPLARQIMAQKGLKPLPRQEGTTPYYTCYNTLQQNLQRIEQYFGTVLHYFTFERVKGGGLSSYTLTQQTRTYTQTDYEARWGFLEQDSLRKHPLVVVCDPADEQAIQQNFQLQIGQTAYQATLVDCFDQPIPANLLAPALTAAQRQRLASLTYEQAAALTIALQSHTFKPDMSLQTVLLRAGKIEIPIHVQGTYAASEALPVLFLDPTQVKANPCFKLVPVGYAAGSWCKYSEGMVNVLGTLTDAVNINPEDWKSCNKYNTILQTLDATTPLALRENIAELAGLYHSGIEKLNMAQQAFGLAHTLLCESFDPWKMMRELIAGIAKAWTSYDQCDACGKAFLRGQFEAEVIGLLRGRGKNIPFKQLTHQLYQRWKPLQQAMEYEAGAIKLLDKSRKTVGRLTQRGVQVEGKLLTKAEAQALVKRGEVALQRIEDTNGKALILLATKEAATLVPMAFTPAENFPAVLDPDDQTEGGEENRDGKEEDTLKYVTIYRAPQNAQKANKELMQGYDAADFPRVIGSRYPNGGVYFAPPGYRKVAEYWQNTYYKSGIIEITMPEDVYNAMFMPKSEIDGHEFGEDKYFAPPPEMGINPREVVIPREKFELLNKFPRILKPF